MNIKRWRISLIFCLFVLLTSCSIFSFKRDQGPLSQEGAVSDTNPSDVVSKKQYDDLKVRYDSLLQASQNGAVAGDQASQEILNDLNSAKGSESFQTVDVFNDYPQEASKVASNEAMSNPSSSPSKDSIDQDMAQLAKISAYLATRDFDNAMNMLKPLENSPVRQVQTQAKFLLAESLFLQNEFDLAMQVYEEIIRKDAYSSLVLKSLGRLIVCAEKLKIEDKKEKYYSLLHDFFEAS